MSDYVKNCIDSKSCYDILRISTNKGGAVMKRPTIIEFSGLPNSGKTTLLRRLEVKCRNNSVNAIILQEPAELLPKSIPKGVVEQNLWITLKTLSEALELSFRKEADYFLLDRGYYNQLFWATMYVDTNPEYAKYVRQLVEEFGERFNVKPDYLYVIDVDVEEALKRRAASGEPVTFSKEDFLRNYRKKFAAFVEGISQKLYLDTTNMGKDEVAEVVYNQIITL